MTEQQDFLTVEEAAKRLKVNPETVRRWLRRGKMRAIHHGGRTHYRIPVSEVRKFEDES